MLETDPQDLALDDDGDLALGDDGAPYFSSGVSGVKQACQIALSMIRGEWFLDLDAGVPWLEREGVPADAAILGQRFSETHCRAEIIAALIVVPGVAQVTSIAATFDGATRTASIVWEVLTTFGETVSDTLERGD